MNTDKKVKGKFAGVRLSDYSEDTLAEHLAIVIQKENSKA